MTGVIFSIGYTVTGDEFSDDVNEQNGVLSVQGEFDLYFRDEFVGPLDIGLEVGGELYPITSKWYGTLTGQIHLDAAQHIYG